MLVNSALKEIPSSGAPINYVMHEAAVSSEAFVEAYVPSEGGPIGVNRLLNHARKLGYPDPGAGAPLGDEVWRAQEVEVGQRVATRLSSERRGHGLAEALE